MVDSYKREYLDPRTKKVEKARIAARIVATVRNHDPPGRFLKEDPHTGLWVEIGDERAWKKAGQALRESAPEIRAERQAQLQMLAGVGPVGGGGGGGGGGGSVVGGGADSSGSVMSKGRKSRQADPPGPRHRPNPPEREGLARSSSNRSNSQYDDLSSARGGRENTRSAQQQQQQQQQQALMDEDEELARMRQEYLQMMQLQQEQRRRMLQYQNQLQQKQQHERSGGNPEFNNRDVYDEYQQMQQGLMGNYRQQVHQRAQAMVREGRSSGTHAMGEMPPPQSSSQQGRYPNHHQHKQEVAKSIMDDGLLPVNAGFDIPSLRGEAAARERYHQQQMQNSFGNSYQDDFDQSGAIQAQEAFDRHFNSCDKTVSTMSSFDIQSMDMSSLGGFTWEQGNVSGMTNNFDMSLISTGSTHMGSSRYNNFNSSGMSNNRRPGAKNKGGGGKSGKGGGKSALERKLEKVNEAHRREMQKKAQQQQPPHEGHMPHPQGGIAVPTAGGDRDHQRGPTKNRSSRSNNNRYSDSNHNMSSLNSFGFEAIEEDELTEASYKMSNLGLSEMDMTFSSDVLSVRSKSAAKVRSGDENAEREKEGSTRKKGPGGSKDSPGAQKRSSSAGDAEVPPTIQRENVGLTASTVFNTSLSSGTTSSLSNKSASNKNNIKNSPHNFSMEDFNESFKSMEMEERTRSSGRSSGGSSSEGPKPQPQQRLPDPDGAMGGQGTYHSSMPPPHSRRKDPNGGRLPSINSSRASNHSAARTAAASNIRLSSSSNNHKNNASRRESVESMGISDPDMMSSGNIALGNSADFGVSLESLRSFQSTGSDASSWLQQYNSMENINSDKNPWDDEDGASGGTSASEISAPRMVMAAGGNS